MNMKKLVKLLALLIVTTAVVLNLWLYRAETQIIADPNDNVFQYSLVHRTNWVWENYGCPISLECLPNLIDHNVTYWAEGYSLPFYYSHLPQIGIVASHKLVVAPLSNVIGSTISLYEYYNFTKYILLSVFPVPVFLALILIGFPLVPSALAAFFATHYSTDGLYGIDPPSFLWRGYGLTSQLYAMTFFPLAVAFTYRALEKSEPIRIYNSKFIIPNSFLAGLFLTLTTAGHLGIGILALLSISPLIFIDFNIKNIIKRSRILLFIILCLLFVLSYWIIPILFNNQYHIVSFWDPIWKFNSYGWYEVIRQFLQGEIFDWQRTPILTAIITVGFFLAALKTELLPFTISFALMFVLYFGRSTWGGLIDLIPGMKDFHQHRFIVGVHLTSLFLLPAFFDFLLQASTKLTKLLYQKYEKVKEVYQLIPWFSPFLVTVSILILAYFTFNQTIKYNSLNHRWIYEANSAYRYSKKDFKEILKELDAHPKGRIYAGRPGNWGKEFRLGSSQIFMLLSTLGYDVSQWLPETWSMMSENDQNFDERVAPDYDLLNIRYVIIPTLSGEKKKDITITSASKLLRRQGPFELYEVPTSGWFDVVESPMFVSSDKTNFLNLVYLWHRGYPRTWKMHPLISVEKNPEVPSGMQRQIKMVDEVSYIDSSDVKNIFADFAFAFPQSTPSSSIKNEKVTRQTYSATVQVPDICKNCMIMFKMSYHPNWQVKVDGLPVQKYAVFPMYVATPATPGTHTIEITHKPNSLKVFLLVLEVITVPVILYLIKKAPRFRRAFS